MEHADDSAEDFELRQKPPFMEIPGQDGHATYTEQQQEGLNGIFDHRLDDFKDCMMIHQYAEPLQVVDSLEASTGTWAKLHKGKTQRYKLAKKAPEEKEDESDDDKEDDEGDEGDDDKEEEPLPILTKPGSVYDAATHGGAGVHVSTSMFADLKGVTNPVQVIAHGPVSRWSSKWKVPISGFLCMSQDHSDSAPLFYALPTPCVATTLDQEGNKLDPLLDPFEVWIGSTRVGFRTKAEGEDFCFGFAEHIAEDLTTQEWDSEHLGKYLAQHEGGGHIIEVVGQSKPWEEPEVPPGLAPSPSPAMSPAAPPAGSPLSPAPAVPFFAPAPAPPGLASLIEKSRHLRTLRSLSHRLRSHRSHSHRSQHRKQMRRALKGKKRSRKSRKQEDADDEEDTPKLNYELRRERRRMRAGKKAHTYVHDVAIKGMPSDDVLMNPNLMSFVLASGKKSVPDGWTKGTKKLLVVVMDWKAGDNSLAPYSNQQTSPEPVAHYRDVILPRVQKQFADMSFGQYGIQFDVVPEVIRFLRNRHNMPGKLPFPALYNEAREAVQHGKYGEDYLFRSYDLVFVISPQVQPVGTKGVAWVGSRGAVCNGCETVSDNFKTMIMVHELGHNLGLSHASSEALEYGNPFDWMGNYPDVVGLHYGLGYKRELGWITDDNVFQIKDSGLEFNEKVVAGLSELNDVVYLKPFDIQAPGPGDVVGVRIHLKQNHDDVYLGYRGTAGDGYRGLYVIWQSKDAPNSKMMDAACHSISQRDSHLREGWTWVDDSKQIVVKVVKQTDEYVQVHLYHMSKGGSKPSDLRARPLFTDGKSKCPVTCQDADLLISQTCQDLSKDGYCNGGSLSLNGMSLSIGMQVCPNACGNCDALIKSTSLEVSNGGAVCKDQNVKISGMGCPDIAAKDMCQMKTTSGKHLGRDLCPLSCDLCPNVIKGPPPCMDKNVKISGMGCPEIAAKDMCKLKTKSGKVLGADLCPMSCDLCPAASKPAADGADPTPDPSPARTHGGGGAAFLAVGDHELAECPEACKESDCKAGDSETGGVELTTGQEYKMCSARCSKPYGGDHRFCGFGELYEGPGSIDCSACVPPEELGVGPGGDPTQVSEDELATATDSEEASEKKKDDDKEKDDDDEDDDDEDDDDDDDEDDIDPDLLVCADDEYWVDEEGHGCEVYAATLKEWGRQETCFNHLAGQGAIHCRKTCGTCAEAHEEEDHGCSDNVCIGPWKQAYGRCFQCDEFPNGCTEPEYKEVFLAECPLTCGVCKPAEITTPPPDPEDVHSEEDCVDEEPKFCKSLGFAYCSEERMSSKCKRTCEMCPPPGTHKEPCHDVFSSYTCRRYESWGWCERHDTGEAVRLQCALTCGTCVQEGRVPSKKANRTYAMEGEEEKEEKEEPEEPAEPEKDLHWDHGKITADDEDDEEEKPLPVPADETGGSPAREHKTARWAVDKKEKKEAKEDKPTTTKKSAAWGAQPALLWSLAAILATAAPLCA